MPCNFSESVLQERKTVVREVAHGESVKWHMVHSRHYQQRISGVSLTSAT